MTIILFLIDTSSSMCQKAYVNGVQKTYLDIAKGAVETFLKYRQRTQDCMGDRYMLLTFEEPPANVKAGWKENHATFMNELKNLQSTGLTSMGESLKNAFDLLNLNRMQSGIDTYGQGRCPFYLEPSVIIVITDGGRYSYRNGVHPEIILPLNTQMPGTKFTKEPFRWDQRLFSLVLRISGNKTEERVEGKVPHDDSPIERMCEVTGGRSYRVRTHHVLNQCIESLVQKVQPGVVLQFEPMIPREMNPTPNEALHDIVFPPTKKMIYVPKHITQKTFPIGYWPLPEPYWPDPKAVTLPPRDAHPKLRIVTPAVDEPQMVRNFPIDKYEIEASPLTLQILQKREMNKCWQVIISNGMHGFELPFGYLKAAPNFSQVHLYVLAYNYPALLPLLHDLIHKYNMNPPSDLMYKFNAYVRSIPPYYCPFLRKALLNINVPYPVLQFLLPENVDNYLSPNIANQLKHIKNTAKQEQENLCMKVYKQLKQPKPPYRQVETAKLNPGVPLRRDLVRHPLLRDTFTKMHSEIEPLENFTIVVPQLTRQPSAKSYRNPFEIPRRDIVEEISRMREMFLRPTPTSLIAKDSGHCLPIAEMGNYQEYLKNKDIPLRELEPTNVRQHMFGNPYKKDKHISMVDEADLSDVAPMKAGNGVVGVSGGSLMPLGGMVGMSKKYDSSSRVRKRKAGPIRKDFVFRRLSTSISSSPSSSPSGGSMSPANSLTDYEDDSSSETSSISSGISSEDSSDNERGTMEPFDFNEESTEQDFPLNGYVHSFINGADESCENVEMNSLSSNSAPLIVSAGASNMNNGGVLVPSNSINLMNPMSIPNGLVQVAPPTIAPHTYMSNSYGQPMIVAEAGNVLLNPLISATAPTILQPAGAYGAPQVNGTSVYPNNINSAVVPPAVVQMPAVAPINAPNVIATPPVANSNAPSTAAAAAAANTPQHNNINDAQAISRILQQCHNGNSSNASSAGINAHFDMVVVNDAKGEFPTPNLAAAPPQSNAFGTHLANSATAAAAAALSNCFDNLKRESSSNVINHNHHQLHPHPQLQNSTNSNHATSNHVGNHQPNQKRRNNAATAAAAAPAIVVPALTEEQREAARRHNLDLRSQVFREIRRPGRNYTQLLEHMSLVKGDFDMKSSFVQMCITESLRFRRKQMVSSIEAWWEKKKHQIQQPVTSS